MTDSEFTHGVFARGNYRLPYDTTTFDGPDLMGAHMRCECTLCGDTFEGSAFAGIQWQQAHRVSHRCDQGAVA